MTREEISKAKAALKKAFPRTKVSVRGGRGTAAAWLYVKLHDVEETDYLHDYVLLLVEQAGTKVGRYYTDSGPGDCYEPCLLVEVHVGS